MTNLKDLGEFGLIERLSKNFKHQANDTILPLGDDCAVYSASASKYQLISTDALVDNIHFKSSTIPPEQLGQKAIAVNLSDIAAMGGTPTRVLITLGISKKISISFLFVASIFLTKSLLGLISAQTTSNLLEKNSTSFPPKKPTPNIAIFISVQYY